MLLLNRRETMRIELTQEKNKMGVLKIVYRKNHTKCKGKTQRARDNLEKMIVWMTDNGGQHTDG